MSEQFPPVQPQAAWTSEEHKVVGMTFVKGYPDNIHALAEANKAAEQASGLEGVAGVLVRNPQNRFDANAIEVHVPGIGMLGHIPAKDGTANRLAPLLDAGQQFHIAVTARIDPDHETKPGVSIVITAVQ